MEQELLPRLFKTEFSKITAVLCKRFGIEHIETAEDIASETFLAATETWSHKGIPENATAWLYTVAKNKARNHFNRKSLFQNKISKQLKYESAKNREFDIDLSDENISDSQLQMLLAVCHPSISQEAQIGLALRILCGFGIEEIADAFLSNKETINKRLYRARKKLREEQITIEVPDQAEIYQRLDTVLRTLYLLFNEGYYSESDNKILKKDLCLEAMRLTHLLAENEQTRKPAVHALLALMCFHSSRFEARKNNNGELVLYHNQDESLWNEELIARGAYFLKEASQGSKVSKYHLEASIAWWHTQKEDTKEKWSNILGLYNQLLITEYSPIAALNRTYALSKVHGKKAAIAEAQKLNLSDNHYYHTLLGELYKDVDIKKAENSFQEALSLAKTKTDKQTLKKKMDKL
ncbi:RNA polymerase sigma factor [Halalkalibaculum sp. DA3122]|uniref:RNA polymerase sigma factor n=1 Tax=Halalkalibaculum sp. DA3122 TaxID=3373607 RepID=UPI00375439D8